ncbi:hypothetical protein HOP50_03g26360 [Chloropicon primus]|uniref:Caltractin n=1 Tax=Chloropicon primus TaxID=1764295 RepID=A0A5B8MI49_9CHLO|nr:hypothetical protein A3770_03p26350 [Chloropicon primus]UPQ99329.1 hypothetical protein HOP50_03g26360 [Chloropicon primus]|mmetsp:Transcript_2543/g.7018  ORF Transcript_2543/g.7018 Transcript_2543/m.7018 type:complete len:320 (-) Transcript_2543:122-1081(-)|eukprot:QDZ20117.1 hypothetical protein A3770_03p26350 [Chloropicon primus]
MSKPKARFICTKPQGLGTGTTVWLQKHGVSVRPSLSSRKIQEITAVFELFDEDDSGAIVVEEAHTALKLLGLRATKSQVAKLVEKYDVNDSGDLDLDEFIQMMTEHLVDQEDEAQDAEGDNFDMNSLKDSGFNTHELNLVLGALRRRNLLQALLEKDYKGLDMQQRRLRNSVLASGLRPIPEKVSPEKMHRRTESHAMQMEQIRKARKESMMMYFRSKRKLKLPKIDLPKKKSLHHGVESPEPLVKLFTGKSPLLRKGNYNEIAQKISRGKFSTPLLRTIAGGRGPSSATGRSGAATTAVHRFPGLDNYLTMKSSRCNR